MLNVRSFQLFSSESISSNLDPKSYAKTERRLRELSQLLGISTKGGWPSVTSTGQSSLSKSSIIFPHGNTTDKINAIHWSDAYQALVLVLSSGILVWLLFDPVNLDSISSIHFDRHLVGKIKTDHIVNILFESKRILISYTNSKITYILLDDKKSRVFQGKLSKPFKLKTKGAKFFEYELDVKNGSRRIERHLLLSRHKDEDEILIVWWQNGSNKLCPWSSPSSSTKEFCNVMIYNVLPGNLDLVGFGSIVNDILKMEFCRMRPNTLMTVESDFHPDSLLYREYHTVPQGDTYILEMIESVRLNVPAKCLRADINISLNKVLILCANRTVVMYNIDQNTISFFQAPINAIDLVNCPLDSFFVVSDSCGQTMMYDYSLHVLSANYDDLFLKEALCGLDSIKFLGNNLLCLRFAEDPNLTFVTLPYNLDFTTLIKTYVNNDYLNEAIENLKQLNWNDNSFLAHTTLNIIFNHLIRLPLNSINESHLQATLSAFYIPKIQMNEDIVDEYQYEMHCLAKRFFFHLYHYMCLEKAFLLALDLKSRHLFILLYKIAKERGNPKLAQVSLRYAQQFTQVEGKQRTPINMGSLTCNDTESSNTSFKVLQSSSNQEDKDNYQAFELNNNMGNQSNFVYLNLANTQSFDYSHHPQNTQTIQCTTYRQPDDSAGYNEAVSEATIQLKNLQVDKAQTSNPYYVPSRINANLSENSGPSHIDKQYSHLTLGVYPDYENMPVVSQQTQENYSKPISPPIPAKSQRHLRSSESQRVLSQEIYSTTKMNRVPHNLPLSGANPGHSRDFNSDQLAGLENQSEHVTGESDTQVNPPLLDRLIDKNYLPDNRQIRCVHLGLV